MRKTLWITFGLVFAAVVVSIAVWSQVPNPMPVHWNAAGQADGFAPRAIGLLMLPAITAVITPFVAWITNKKVDTPKGKTALTVILISIAAFMLGMHVLMVQAALRADAVLSMGGVMSMMGVLFAVLGAVMPMLPQNKVAGVRTPWTLSNETNWKLTHRFAAWTMGISGVIAAIAGLLLSGVVAFWVGFSAVMIGSLVPVAYSYLLHKVQKDRL